MALERKSSAPKLESAASRIEKAVAKLLAEKKTLTRRAIAEIAGCQIRTVSIYKDLWRDNAPDYRNTPNPVESPVIQRLTVEEKVEELESLDIANLDIESLNSLEVKLNWYADCLVQYPDLCNRVLLLSKMARQTIRGRAIDKEKGSS